MCRRRKRHIAHGRKTEKIGVEYQKEKISDDTYMKIYYPNPEKTLWDKLDAYLNS